MRLLYKETYFDDLEVIENYVANNFNAELALRVVREIHRGCLILAEQPRFGRIYARNPYFRYLIVKGKNLVFYHLDEEAQAVLLHRVFDSRRDYADAVSNAAEL